MKKWFIDILLYSLGMIAMLVMIVHIEIISRIADEVRQTEKITKYIRKASWK